MSHALIQQMHAEDGCDGETLAECIQQLRDQRDGARYALEAERTAIIDGVNGIVKEIDSRAWIANSRGPYEWNDDRYRQEFVDAGAAIFGALEPLRKIGSDLSNCPRTTKQVIEARQHQMKW